jgi:hypothetical protein
MAKAMKLARILSGCAAAGLVAVTVASAGPAKAAGKKAKAVGGFQVQSINVALGASVPGNIIVEVKCSQAVNPDSVTPATLQVRGKNATKTGYSKQVFGSAQVVGNVIRFYPRLPTHLRDSTGKFYPQGSAKDSAGDNAAFQPQTDYQISVVGSPAITAITSTSGRKLKAGPANTTQFTIAAASPPERLWTALTYSDSPPPQFSFANPPDTVPSAAGQYSTHGGTQDVPSAILMSLYCTKVPLSPSSARNLGNVAATMLARKGDYSLRRPVFGSVFVEQNFDTTLLAFQPQVALADLGIFSLRVTKGVKDLTEQNDFAPNRARDQLNTIYVFLSSARSLAPTVPVAQLPDPPAELITDWPKKTDPGGDAARGVLKTNVLALGDAYPDEVDPRTMLIFTTRDEPVTQDSITVEFTKAENLFDPLLSIGTVDSSVPGAAAAVFTASGGDASLGDLKPTGSNFVVPSSAYAPGAILNYKDVAIPQGTTVTLAGGKIPDPNPSQPGNYVSTVSPPLSAPATPPVTLKCLTFQLDGQISADGGNGIDGNQSGTYSANDANTAPGGAGGPGGGNGGIAQFGFGFLFTSGSGGVGNDVNLVPASAVIGGRGGLGGQSSNNTVYAMGGGGGGGGSKTAGSPGTPGTYSTASWNGTGGAGGLPATGTPDLSTLVGGAGGGGGAKAMCVYYSSGTRAATGGGGGGAVMIQTAGILTINQSGVVHARGGIGGKGAYASPAMGGGAGGGGGGAVLLRSSRGFSLASPTTAISVAGGAGGPGQTGSYPSGNGGAGGVGFAKLEDPNGAFQITGITIPGGVYQPVGAGVPSFVYTKWVDLGVQDPRVVQWKNADIATVTTNDAIYVSAQMTKESATVFGKPDLSALKTSDQSSTNVSIMSQWQPIKVHDLTGVVGGAFTSSLGPIPGYPPNPPTEYSGFDPSPLIGKGYKFLRFRIYFQLDPTQTATAPMPYVDRIVTTFQYNF